MGTLLFVFYTSHLPITNLCKYGKFRFKKTLQNGDPIYHSVGYITVYRFFNYPDKFRKRISQVLILPPYQRAGHASALLNTIYNNSKEDKIRDITVESPSPDFMF